MDNHDCIFCKIASGEIPGTVVYEDDRCLAFRDLNPQAPTHVLVIPRRHVETLNDATDEDRELLGHLMLAAQKIARVEGHAESGYRLVLNTNRGAGQSVFHIHLHVLGGRAFEWPPG